MKCIYFDCFAGISGDMTLGAFIDLGVPRHYLSEELKKLRLSGYRISVSRAMRMGIAGRRVKVQIDKQQKHPQRSYKTIAALISKSSLKRHIKDLSIEIFYRLAQAEAQIHQQRVADVHFHEIGALDSIVDIVGSIICLDYVGADKCYSSPLPISSGFVKSEHGTLPIPAPATLELLRGVPVVASEVRGELVTPTGAAILTTLTRGFGLLPQMTIHKIGYGAGMHDYSRLPNMLRIILGEADALPADNQVWILEANIDDMNPEWTGFLVEQLLNAGALDVSLIPLYMKKNRPGVMLQVICSEQSQPELLQVIFRESTTAGVRYYRAGRTTLTRSKGTIKTKFGILKVKVFSRADGNIVTPEFEECKRVAQHAGVPLREVYEAIIAAARKDAGGVKLTKA